MTAEQKVKATKPRGRDTKKKNKLLGAQQDAKKLTPKQHQVAMAYIAQGFKGLARAYRTAYPDTTQGTAEVNCHRLLNLPHVKAFLDRAREAVLYEAEVQTADILREYARLAFVDPGQLFGPDGRPLPIDEIPEDARRAISGLTVSSDLDGSVVTKIKLPNKKEALDSLAKINGLFVDKSEVLITTDPVHVLLQEIDGKSTDLTK